MTITFNMGNFKTSVEEMINLIQASLKTEFSKEDASVYSYKSTRAAYYKKEIANKIRSLRKDFRDFSKTIENKRIREQAELVMDSIESNNIEEMKTGLIKVKELIKNVSKTEDDGPVQKKEVKLPPVKKSFILTNMPKEIDAEVKADIEEIERCFGAGCYRSVVILCGRVLETALHRKYYEVTENDLLEKAPGIGLGKIIAKLEEKNITLVPGLTQQIHLINQMRIYSVHKKNEPFYPSKNQAEAIYLFTKDVLERMFK